MPGEKVVLKIGGMTCSSCATTVKNILEKEGAKNVFVDFSIGETIFEKSEDVPINKFIKAIEKSGYIVRDEKETNVHQHHQKVKWLFMVSAVFTVPLLINMLVDIPLVNRFEVQLILSTIVVFIGIYYFGKSAFQSLIHKNPNMNVLILTGAVSAYIYSILGWSISGSHYHMFFETSASIITLVLLGNLVEEYSIAKTTSEIKKLQKSNEIKYATKKTEINGQVHYQNILTDNVSIGDIILIKEGEQVPLDCKIISGEVDVNESVITGESIPVYKKEKNDLTAGSIVIKGTAEAVVIRKKSDTILAQIIETVKKAQRDKTEIQKLGDRISSVFVPVVLIMAIVTLGINYLLLNNFSESILRSIAVLVIACPCAMGIAAPTAIAVSLGIAAKNKILFKASSAFELLTKSNVFVFDKTGTLTTGLFCVEKFENFSSKYTDEKILSLVYSAEKYSLHPIAKSISDYCKNKNVRGVLITELKEEKGIGISFKECNDNENIIYKIGSYRILKNTNALELKSEFDVFVTANDVLIAGFKLKDELKTEVKGALEYLKKQGKIIYMLSGDKKERCMQIAKELNIPEKNVFYEKLPEEKLSEIDKLKKKYVVCMVGDGINDAPAMAKANVSVSFNNSSSIAIDSADVIISHQDVFSKLITVLNLSRITVQKIKQNYFWAFFYNIIAIPVAAAGFLSPIIAALSMAFSDIIVVGNSLNIYRKKI